MFYLKQWQNAFLQIVFSVTIFHIRIQLFLLLLPAFSFPLSSEILCYNRHFFFQCVRFTFAFFSNKDKNILLFVFLTIYFHFFFFLRFYSYYYLLSSSRFFRFYCFYYIAIILNILQRQKE